MHVMPVFVCCHTNYWTQQMVNGFTKHFPNIKMLAIDNNPYTYQNIDSDGHGYHKNPSWNISCEIERKFINQHPDIFVLPAFNYASHVQKANTHGKCLDIASSWISGPVSSDTAVRTKTAFPSFLAFCAALCIS